MSVFTWSAIRNGCVSGANALTEVFEEARRLIAAHENCFAAAVFYGSVPRGEHSCRSDFDWYVVLDPAHERKARTLISRVRTLSVARNVASHVCVLTPGDIVRKPTLFGPSFVPMWEQLRTQDLVFGKPERFAGMHFASVQEEMRERVAGAHAFFVRNWQRDLRFMQAELADAWVDAFVRKTRRKHTRPLQFLWKVARVLLCARDGRLEQPSKARVFSALYEDRRFHPLLSLFSDLKLCCGEYDHLFTEAKLGKIDEATYGLRLGRILARAVKLNATLHTGSEQLLRAGMPILRTARRRVA